MLKNSAAYLVRRAEEKLIDAACPDPRTDALLLAQETLGMTRIQLRFDGDKIPDLQRRKAFDAALERRLSGEPLQHILGTTWFMGLCFRTDKRALIPRQDTETVVETAVSLLKDSNAGASLLDLCSGSGCIGLSLAKLRPGLRVTLSDISPAALELSKENAALLGVNAEFIESDMFSRHKGRQYDFIISNPPYIPECELGQLQKELSFEPQNALNGGGDGLDFYRRIAEEAPDYIKAGGRLILEIGAGQAEAVCGLLEAAFDCITTTEDLNGIERVVSARRKEWQT